MRLRTNPELRNLISTNPDVFIYGEAETPSPHNLELTGYDCYLHKSKLEIDGNFRRGLAIFYLTKYRYIFTKEYSSRDYDIVWMCLKTTFESIFSVFFTPPVHITPYPFVLDFMMSFLRLLLSI